MYVYIFMCSHSITMFCVQEKRMYIFTCTLIYNIYIYTHMFTLKYNVLRAGEAHVHISGFLEEKGGSFVCHRYCSKRPGLPSGTAYLYMIHTIYMYVYIYIYIYIHCSKWPGLPSGTAYLYMIHTIYMYVYIYIYIHIYTLQQEAWTSLRYCIWHIPV
jgi:hypothetical protein